jgi:hypothetical protein
MFQEPNATWTTPKMVVATKSTPTIHLIVTGNRFRSKNALVSASSSSGLPRMGGYHWLRVRVCL